MTTKLCTRCRQDKAPDEFHRNAKAKDGRQHYCKVCLNRMNAEQRKRRAEQGERTDGSTRTQPRIPRHRVKR